MVLKKTIKPIRKKRKFDGSVNHDEDKIDDNYDGEDEDNYDDENMFRNFEGIEGDSNCRGELFGMENILQFHVIQWLFILLP